MPLHAYMRRLDDDHAGEEMCSDIISVCRFFHPAIQLLCCHAGVSLLTLRNLEDQWWLGCNAVISADKQHVPTSDRVVTSCKFDISKLYSQSIGTWT